MIRPKKILKNSVFITSGVLVDGVILFFVFVLIARYLNVHEFGRLAFLMSMTNVFQIFASGGMVNITIREIARSRENVQKIIGAASTLSLLTLMGIFSALYCVVDVFVAVTDLKITVYILVGAALIMVHAAVHAAVLRAFEDMGRVALTALVHKITLLMGVLSAIYLDTGMRGVATAYLFAAAVNWSVFFILVRVYYVRSRWCFDLDYWFFLVKEAVPLGLGLVTRRLTIHMDTFLLGILSTATAVGLFNSAYRVTQMLEVAVLALSGVLFPVFSRLGRQSEAEFSILFNHSLRILVIFCTPIAVWLMVLSREIIVIAYGNAYLDSARVLAILAGSLFFLIPGSLFFSVFSALNRQRSFLALTIAALIVNGSLDYWLIPIYSYVGAATATLITEIMVFLAGALLLYKFNISAPYRSIYIRCLLSCALPAIVLYWSESSGSYLLIVIASLVYMVLSMIVIFRLKLITKDEWYFFRRMLRPRKAEA